MVKVHQLSAEFVLALDADLQEFKKLFTSANKVVAGQQLPRTRWRWLIAHFNDAKGKRSDVIQNHHSNSTELGVSPLTLWFSKAKLNTLDVYRQLQLILMAKLCIVVPKTQYGKPSLKESHQKSL